MTNRSQVLAVVPLLYVDDVQASVAFYRDGLGFRLVATDGGEPFGWCRLEREGAAIMLQLAGQKEDGPAAQRGRGVILFFMCDDATALHRELTERGLVVAPPEVAAYGMNQVELRDPDGYQLCFENPVASADAAPS